MNINSLLVTRDGTKFGNAIIVDIRLEEALVVVDCISDYGNYFSLSAGRLETYFKIGPVAYESHKYFQRGKNGSL